MLERLKEMGYDFAALGALIMHLVNLMLVVFYKQVLFQEPMQLVLKLEVLFLVGLIIWGIERIVKDWYRE